MSSDFVHFLLILYLIYVSDCLILSHTSVAVVYARVRGGKWRIKTSNTAPSFGGRFWLLRPLLPPFGSSFRLSYARCAFGRIGFCNASPVSDRAGMDKTIRYLAYDRIDSVVLVDGELRINGLVWLKGRNAELRAVSTALDEIRRAPDRTAAVRMQLEAEFTKGARAQEQIVELERQTSLLNMVSFIYALWLLVLLPVAVYRFTVLRLVWSVIVPVLLLHLVCGVLFLRIHGRLLPSERALRWETFFKMFLCPPMMLRACDPIHDQAGISGDAVAAMLSCSSRKQWFGPLKQIWRRLIPSRWSELTPDTAVAMKEYADIYRSVLEGELTQYGITSSELEVDASRMPADGRFCPRCETVYRDEIEECADCGGVPLSAGREG